MNCAEALYALIMGKVKELSPNRSKDMLEAQSSTMYGNTKTGSSGRARGG
jgi:hypothetical protein